jgi:hypothetical protein
MIRISKDKFKVMNLIYIKYSFLITIEDEEIFL